MEGYTIFMDWETSYCKDGDSPKIHVYIKCHPQQIPESFFFSCGTNKLILKFTQKFKGQEKLRQS